MSIKKVISNVNRKSSNEGFKNLKARFQLLQLKKNLEFFDSKVQTKEENDDITNPFFE
jgi:hypothetical protein